MRVKFLILAGLLALLAGAPEVARSAPVVFWASSPINPGETALLFGDDLGPEVSAEGWRVPENGLPPAPRKLEVLQASEVAVKVVIPEDWAPGRFAVRLRRPAGTSAPVFLNRPEVWWWLGDDGARAVPGGEIRVFGRNLEAAASARLVAAGRSFPLARREGESYAARFAVPADVPTGDYELRLDGEDNAAAGARPAPRVRVATPPPWPDAVYDVRAAGAVGDGERDDTGAFRDALGRARTGGGGVVYVPRGNYRVSGKLAIPPRTVLRGAGRDVAGIFSPKDAPEFDALLAGDRDFAVEDLSLASQTARRLVACPDQPSSYRLPHGGAPPAPGLAAANVRLQRLRLQHLHFAHRLNRGDSRREEIEGPATVVMSGRDLTIADCEIVSPGMPIAIHGAERLRVADNILHTGRNGWYGLWATREVVFEGNTVEGGDLEASLGGFQQGSCRIYFARNRIGPAYGNEREALAFDAPYAPRWMGRAARVQGATLATVDEHGEPRRWKPHELQGEACLIAWGRGLGQYIPIADNSEDTITLDHPWAVPPDASSLIVVRVNRTEIVVTGNHFLDASVAVQLYAQSYGVIIDGNTAERTGGSYGLAWDFWWRARDTRRYSTCMFNQWLHNRFSDGFVYQQGPWLAGFVGVAADPANGNVDPPAATILGNVIRNNTVTNGITIGARLAKAKTGRLAPNRAGYLGRDTVIEGNRIADAPLGIEVDQQFVDTVVRHNTVERCTVPFRDAGRNTWSDFPDAPARP